MLLRTPAPPPAAAPVGALPGDVRAMNALAALVLAMAGIVLVATASAWVARRPQFALGSVRLEGDLQRNNVSTVRANAMARLAGNFFTLDLEHARAAFEQVPWVRHAVVRRVWPNQLVVTLEEHQPVALWSGDDNSDQMVNSHGEVFEANVGDVEDDSLPEFSGPPGSAARVLAMYQRLLPALRPLESDMVGLALSGRGSWRVELEGGAAVELGRGTQEEVVERVQRFVRTLPQLLRKFHAPLESADLRHAEGYAVKLKGVTVAAGSNLPAPQASGREE